MDERPRPATALLCQNIGISGTTQTFVRKDGEKWVARVGIAILGYTNTPLKDLAEANPFDPDFHDNYGEGVGTTEEGALKDLQADIKRTCDGLWF